MKNMNMVRNFLLAGAVAWTSAAQSAETVAWIDGGLDTSWPVNATGGTWYCQNVSSLKWTESAIPGIPKKVAGVTLENWAHVGLKYTATEPLNLGFGGGVTETRISTQVLLQPVLREDLPKVDSDDKGGVILVLEDDGALRYYVVAQEDETNGTGANVWKLAGSVPRVTDETVPSTIVIRIHQDGPRWLVDYTIDGTAEAQHVIAVGLAPTVSSVRYTGPCTVQALSASCVRYPAWLKTDDPAELANYDALGEGRITRLFDCQ